MSLLSSGLL